MNSFFYRTGTKITGAVLCLISLTTAFLCGLLILLLLGAGTYDSGRSPFEALSSRQLYSDANNIMNGYFDPSDPTHPWTGYDSDGLYTGEDSNLRYSITDDSTGKVVLSTYDQEAAALQKRLPFSFDIADTVTAPESFVVNSLLFRCDGAYYLYNDDLEAFLLVSSSLGQSSASVEVLDADAMTAGFSYPADGPHYSYYYGESGEGFYQDDDWSLDVTSYTTKDYTITCYLLSDSDGIPGLYRGPGPRADRAGAGSHLSASPGSGRSAVPDSGRRLSGGLYGAV